MQNVNKVKKNVKKKNKMAFQTKRSIKKKRKKPSPPSVLHIHFHRHSFCYIPFSFSVGCSSHGNHAIFPTLFIFTIQTLKSTTPAAERKSWSVTAELRVHLHDLESTRRILTTRLFSSPPSPNESSAASIYRFLSSVWPLLVPPSPPPFSCSPPTPPPHRIPLVGTTSAPSDSLSLQTRSSLYIHFSKWELLFGKFLEVLPFSRSSLKSGSISDTIRCSRTCCCLPARRRRSLPDN